MTIKELIESHPSGFDHHDPQQTVEDFYDFMDETLKAMKSDFHL